MISYRKVSLIAGLSLLVFSSQVFVYAAPIETLVMPGPVSAAHADIEVECSGCHAAFSKTLQRDLCLSCHDHISVKEDLEAGTGFHGRSETVGKAECATCHAEHEGRTANIVGLDIETFDHDITDFVLEGSHAERVCEDCHAADKLPREAPSACFDCHEAKDSHKGKLGKECGNCHRETDWQTTKFDHTKDTEYILTGAHQVVECVLCHTNQTYKGISTDCHSCHQIDDRHQGNFGKDCKQCHKTEDWKKNTFDHKKSSDFALQDRHTEIECSSCHLANQFKEELAHECVSCHLADDIHQGANKVDCGACHNSREWKSVKFDHQKDTDFPLNGAHFELECRMCHSGGTIDMELDTACINCHQVNDVHQQSLGENCVRCHGESGWTSDVLFDHDLTRFPLIGMHSVVLCEACHLSPRFADTPGQCLDCHSQSDTQHDTFGTDCGSCHNPNDWLLWEFDHQSTGFVLDGAHADLNCQNCHKKGWDYQAKKQFTCVDCHRNDDIHSGEFGRHCSRCHNSHSFEYSGTIQ